MPSVHAAAHGAIRMLQASRNPPTDPATRRESTLALPTLRRRNPRGHRASATAANASLLQELRIGRSPHRVGIRWSRAGSVGCQRHPRPDRTSRHDDARRRARSPSGLADREL